VQASVAKINGWHESNKVPNEIKAAINNQLDVLYMTGKLNPQNLEAEYKKAYEPYKAFLENVKREALKSYVPDKKADAKLPPSQPKGTPARTSQKPVDKAKFKNREEMTNAIAKEFLQNQAAKRDASPV
jgi:deoxyribodipyrimidine photolyase